jgi:hypothetical protein
MWWHSGAKSDTGPKPEREAAYLCRCLIPLPARHNASTARGQVLHADNMHGAGCGLVATHEGRESRPWHRFSDLLAVVGATHGEIRGGLTKHDVGAQRVESGVGCGGRLRNHDR